MGGGPVVIQVGQCGNGVGASLWKHVAQELANGAHPRNLGGLLEEVESESRGQEVTYRARCILVDTEPKAVRQATQQVGALLKGVPSICGQSGRGNNWAHGYRQPGELGGGHDRGGREGGCLRDTMGEVRRAAERGASEVVLLHSLAGGSGSGLGSRLLEHLRDAYGKRYILAASIAPRPDGDTPLQHYNSALAAQFLHAYADGVLLFQNGDLISALERRMAARRAGPRQHAGAHGAPHTASFAEVNHYVGACLAGALLPPSVAMRKGAVTATQARIYDVRSRIQDIVTTVCPDPALKFMEVRTAPLWMTEGAESVSGRPASGSGSAGGGGGGGGGGKALSWSQCVHGLAELVPSHDKLDGGRAITSSAALVTLRGTVLGAAERLPGGAAAGDAGWSVVQQAPLSKDAASAMAALRSAGLYAPAPWAAGAASTGATVCRECPVGEASESRHRAMTVVANRSNVVGALSTAADRARGMLAANAYVHWYERYDCGGAALMDAVECCTDLADSYRYMHRHVQLE